MAFSTQKDFLNFQWLDDQRDNRCFKAGAIKLKSYGSSLDTRAFDINKKGPANYISDICKTYEIGSNKGVPYTEYDECESVKTRYTMPFHSESEVASLADSVGFDVRSEDDANKFADKTRECEELRQKYAVAELGFRNLTKENKALRALLDTNPINNKCQPLFDAIYELFEEERITEDEKDDFENIIKGLSISLETVNDLQNQLTSLQEELDKAYENKEFQSKLDEPYEKILHERNKLRMQICRMADVEDKIKILKDKAVRSDCLENQLKLANKKLLLMQLAANKQVQSISNRENIRKQLKDAEAIMLENYELKKQMNNIIFEMSRKKNSEKQYETAKIEICRLDAIVKDYERQMQQMMEVVDELQHDKLDITNKVGVEQNCNVNPMSHVKDYRIRELTDASRATFEQMQLECKARNILQMELDATRQELEDLREKSFEDQNKIDYLSSQLDSIIPVLNNLFDEFACILEMPCEFPEPEENEDYLSNIEKKKELLRNEFISMKRRYICEIEVYKQQIERLTELKIMAEQEAANERNAVERSKKLNNDVINKQERISEMQQRTLEETEKALEEQKKLVSSFKQDLEMQKSSIKQSRTSLIDLEEDRKKLISEINALQEEIEVLKSENADLKSEYADLKSEYADLKSENGDLKTENLDLKTENIHLRKENSNVSKELKEKENLLEKAQMDLNKLEKKLKLAEDDLNKINGENSMQIAEFLEKISNLEAELRNIKTELVKKEEVVKKFEGNRKDGDKRMVEVYALKEMETRKNKELKELLDEVEIKISKCSKKDNQDSSMRKCSLKDQTEKLRQDLEEQDQKEKSEKEKNKEKENIAAKFRVKKPEDRRSGGGEQDDEYKSAIQKSVAIGDSLQNVNEKLKFSPLASLSLYTCYTPAAMSKLQIVCKKIFDYGIDCLTIKELTYLHCFIYKASAKHKPEIMENIPGEQKCCKCSNFSCCLPNILRDAEKRLDSRLKVIERDVEILDKSLNFLKQKEDSELQKMICNTESKSNQTCINTNNNNSPAALTTRRKLKSGRNKTHNCE